jgi:hypothetical protein
VAEQKTHEVRTAYERIKTQLSPPQRFGWACTR